MKKQAILFYVIIVGLTVTAYNALSFLVIYKNLNIGIEGYHLSWFTGLIIFSGTLFFISRSEEVFHPGTKILALLLSLVSWLEPEIFGLLCAVLCTYPPND